jgi:hypothetical protein
MYDRCWCGAGAGERCMVGGGYGSRRSAAVGKRVYYVHEGRQLLSAEAQSRLGLLAPDDD